jgi:hypothetical protein
MAGVALWQVKADGQPAVRCVLERLPDGRYRLRLLKGKPLMAFMEHDYPDRPAALQSSILIYRKLKDVGFEDTRPPVVDTSSMR